MDMMPQGIDPSMYLGQGATDTGAMQFGGGAPAPGIIQPPSTNLSGSAINPANYLGGQQGSPAGFDQSAAAGQVNANPLQQSGLSDFMSGIADAGIPCATPGAAPGAAGYGGPIQYNQSPAMPQVPSFGGSGGANPNMAQNYYAAQAAGQAQGAANAATAANQSRLNAVMGMYNTDIGQQTPAAYAQMLALAGNNANYNQLRNQQQEQQGVGQATQRMASMGLANASTMPTMSQAARQPYLTNEANISANAAQQKLGILGQQQNALEGERQSQRGALYGVSNPYPNGRGGLTSSGSYGGYSPSYL